MTSLFDELDMTLEEVKQLHALNIELIQVLSSLGKLVMKLDIPREDLALLSLLLRRADNLMTQIAKPYLGNPVVSDECLRKDKSDEELTEPGSRQMTKSCPW